MAILWNFFRLPQSLFRNAHRANGNNRLVVQNNRTFTEYQMCNIRRAFYCERFYRYFSFKGMHIRDVSMESEFPVIMAISVK